jgi:RHS repeat-associated protein
MKWICPDANPCTAAVGASVTVFVYDAQGELAAEYASGVSPASGTNYLTADHLGSTRLVTDSSGTPQKCFDYFPFGEEIIAGIGGRSTCFPDGTYPSTPGIVSQKFTGKERDAETGLDYFGARYYSGAQGRFGTPDP